VSTVAIELVHTPRLRCERLRPEHAPEYIELMLDPQVARMVWPGPELPTEEDAIASLAAKVAHWGRLGFGQWLLRDRDTGAMVGRGGLQEAYAAGALRIEAGWALVPERWGEGLATEVALASVEVAFGELGLDEIVAFTRPDNVASRRVMEKAGFVYDRDIEHAGLPHVLYRRPADAH
jgi:[ribosomal protein S5]-alanine N-acetyltransferase